MTTIRELQTSLPWTIRYSRDHRANPQTHKDFAHALHHVGKAAGKLHALVDDMDHDREVADDSSLRERHAKYIADLVICALRMANTFPGGVVDLERAVVERIASKNAVATPVATNQLKVGDRVRGRFTGHPGVVHKVFPSGVHVWFDGESEPCDVMCHPDLHLVRADPPPPDADGVMKAGAP